MLSALISLGGLARRRRRCRSALPAPLHGESPWLAADDRADRERRAPPGSTWLLLFLLKLFADVLQFIMPLALQASPLPFVTPYSEEALC